MSSLERLLGVLNVFSEVRPVWTIEQIAARNNQSRSTTYRYVKELVDTGFLITAGRGGFVLGPRIIELDRQIRSCDPMLSASQAIMRDMMSEIGDGSVLLLSALYGEKIVCIHSEPEQSKLPVSYSRGRTLPLFTSSTARVVLAHLPHRRLVRLFADHRTEIRISGLGAEWDDFKASLRAIRRQRVCTTHAAVDAGLLCAAVPVFSAPRTVIGGLCLVQRDYGQPLDQPTRWILDDGGARISRRLASLLPRGAEDAAPSPAFAQQAAG